MDAKYLVNKKEISFHIIVTLFNPGLQKLIIYYCEVIEAGRSGIDLNLYQYAHIEHLHNIIYCELEHSVPSL